MDSLNKDLLFIISLKLSVRDILNLCMVAKKYNTYLGKSSILWEKLLYRDFPDVYDYPLDWRYNYKIFYIRIDNIIGKSEHYTETHIVIPTRNMTVFYKNNKWTKIKHYGRHIANITKEETSLIIWKVLKNNVKYYVRKYK